MLRLEVEYDFDFLVLGISCHEQPYRLCWLLNKHLEMQLIKEEKELCIYHKNHKSEHSSFYYFSEEEDCSYSLIKNRADEGLVIPELPQIDYLLKAECYFGNEDKLLKMIRNLSWVNAAYKIEIEGLRSKENLIFE